jgi:hypothetical protein
MSKPRKSAPISINPPWRIAVICKAVGAFWAFVYIQIAKTAEELHNRWFSILVALCTNPMRRLAAASLWLQHISRSTWGNRRDQRQIGKPLPSRFSFALAISKYYRVSTDRQRVSGLGSTLGPLGEETERRQRRCAGAVLVGNNAETEMANLAEIEALFFALVGGSPGAPSLCVVGVNVAAINRGRQARRFC